MKSYLHVSVENKQSRLWRALLHRSIHGHRHPASSPPMRGDASAPLVPARFLPAGFDSLPADEYGSIAEDCVRVMSNPQAFAVLVGALEQDLQVLVAHHSAVASELDALLSVTLPQLNADCEALHRVACDLQVVYARIDRLSETMDSAFHIVTQLNAVVKHITEATSVKERASGFLRSFGFGGGSSSSSSNNNATAVAPGTGPTSASSRAVGVWSRIPANIVIDGCSPIAYHERIATYLRKLATDAPPPGPAAAAEASVPADTRRECGRGWRRNTTDSANDGADRRHRPCHSVGSDMCAGILRTVLSSMVTSSRTRGQCRSLSSWPQLSKIVAPCPFRTHPHCPNTPSGSTRTAKRNALVTRMVRLHRND
jgi:hypothetical protein